MLFDIAAADALEVLQKNWLLNPEDKKEDKAFLLDHRTKRLQYIGQKDESFANKVASREAVKEADAKPKAEEMLRKDVELREKLQQKKEDMKRELEAGKEEESEDDPDFKDYSSVKKPRRSEVVRVDLPKAPFSDPFVCAARGGAAQGHILQQAWAPPQGALHGLLPLHHEDPPLHPATAHPRCGDRRHPGGGPSPPQHLPHYCLHPLLPQGQRGGQCRLQRPGPPQAALRLHRHRGPIATATLEVLGRHGWYTTE